MNYKNKKELLDVAEHLVFQRLEYSDYYEEELFEQYQYVEEEREYIFDNIDCLLKAMTFAISEISYGDFND